MDPVDPNYPKPDFAGVVDTVMHLFGEVMSREAVSAIVDHYNGDLDQSIEAVMMMSGDQVPAGQLTPTTEQAALSSNNQHVAHNESPRNTAAPTRTHSLSYAGASQSNRRCYKQPSKPKQTISNIINNIWTPQTRQIVDYHTKGSRILILMRGVPGSGKSTLAKQLHITMCPGALFETHIFSTDQYFYDHKGMYDYDKNKLPEAHLWNSNRAAKAMRQGLSPIIIDNTNVELWEMLDYVKEGVRNGYIIEVLEPSTEWAKRPNILAVKNTHKVPIGKIRRMLDRFQNGVTGVYLMRTFRLSYHPDMKPPVLRNLPPIMPLNASINLPLNTQVNPPHQEQLIPNPEIQTNAVSISTVQIHSTTETTVTQPIEAIPPSPGSSNSMNTVISSAHSESMIVSSDDTGNPTENPDSKNETTVDALAQQFEEMEHAWDNGESWDVKGEEHAKRNRQDKVSDIPQPPRSSKNTVNEDKFLPSAENYSDWSNISMFMPPWNDYQNKDTITSPAIVVETATKGTSIEFGDTDTTNKNLKILIGTPKDINFFYNGTNEEKIPEKIMLHKSSMTNDGHDQIATEITRCKNEEKHFAQFRKMFNNISKVELRDIFEKCVGDVNWAVEIVLDGMKNNQLQIIYSGDVSDPDDFSDQQCECLAAYNIIPNVNSQAVANAPNLLPEPEPIAGPSTPRVKKDKVVPESSIQLKRQIEKNVVISDIHYSDHCLKIRKMRRGEKNYTRADSPGEESEESTSAVQTNTADKITEATSTMTSSDEETSVSDEGERTVNVDLGSVFINELDGMFGRDDMLLPEHVETRVNMPISLLNEINALWIESLMYQLDEQSRQSELMLRQDEEFARQLALKEEELARAGQQPAIPDLKEIMDMELALSIYQKEVAVEWRNNEPNDLAARMTREKLYDLFPDVQPEILSELLMAHDNNFQATVEVLLSSTGQGQVLEDPNGLTKFIAKKELERQEKILAKQKKALSEVDWPLLPKDAKVDMVTVQKYRAKASEHLKQRNVYYQRAQEFFNRDMTQVATYYSDVAVLHKKKYDQANSLAAASLMQMHAASCTDNATIDLHFLHVAEAKESLDLFIDTHIKKLRDSAGRSGPRFHSLFFITGRGLHSRGGPRIKPAVKRRLRERGIAFTERNPGLLGSKVCAEDKMTFELS